MGRCARRPHGESQTTPAGDGRTAAGSAGLHAENKEKEGAGGGRQRAEGAGARAVAGVEGERGSGLMSGVYSCGGRDWECAGILLVSLMID